MIFFFLSNSLVQLPTVRQLEGLQNDFTDSISIQREGEAQSKGDDQTSHQNQRIQSRVRIEHVGGRVSAEGEVAREGVNHVEREDDHIGTKDDVAHTLAGRLLQIRENGDKLDLRAVTEAEDGKNNKKVLIEDDALNLRMNDSTHNKPQKEEDWEHNPRRGRSILQNQCSCLQQHWLQSNTFLNDKSR